MIPVKICSLSLVRMLPSQIENKRILLSPLNWGMGHVSRSIGLIHFLLMERNDIVVACDAAQREVYECYFDNLTYIDHQGYPFYFGGKGQFGWDLLKKSSKLRSRLKREQEEVETYVKEHDIDIVISDHRYGFRSKSCPSIFITHQYNLPVKWYQRLVNRFHYKLMRAFDHIWIMDYYDSRLAGSLSRCQKDSRIHFIGPYSRFRIYDKQTKDLEEVLIASGPKIYAQQLVDQFTGVEGIHIICDDEVSVPAGSIRVEGNWRDKDRVILRAKRIISRSGYSTIMDVECLGAECQLFATPGQSEQIYLAKKHGT